MKTRIFATPSEPHFNLEAFAMTPDLLAESLHILAEENDQAIDAENGKIGRFKDGAPVGEDSLLGVSYYCFLLCPSWFFDNKAYFGKIGRARNVDEFGTIVIHIAETALTGSQLF